MLIRYGFTTGEFMVCLVINGAGLPAKKALIDKLCGIEGMRGITFSSNTRRTNVIMGDKVQKVWGDGYITCLLYTSRCV